MNIYILNTKKERKKLEPITSLIEPFEIKFCGLTLIDCIKEVFQEDPAIVERVPKLKKEDIILKSTTIPSISNLKQFLKTAEVEELENPFDIILKHRFDNLDWYFEEKNFFESYKGAFLGKNVTLARNCIIDNSLGNVFIDSNTTVKDFVKIAGPCYIGKNNLIKEFSNINKIDSGTTCKLSGEISNCIFNDFSNKKHLGFVGDSYFGRYVNLGAGTMNSNLKMSYGNIKYTVDGKKVDSKNQFLGTIVGDYTRTGINTSIYGGTIIGMVSSILDTVKKNIKSFHTLQDGKELKEDFSKLVKVINRIKQRRNQKLEVTELNAIKESYFN